MASLPCPVSSPSDDCSPHLPERPHSGWTQAQAMGTDTKPAGRLPSALLSGCLPGFSRVLPDFRHNLAQGANCGERDISAGKQATQPQVSDLSVSSPFLSSLTLLGTSLPLPSELLPPSWRDSGVVMAASSFLCPQPTSPHHLPLPYPPRNTHAFR